MPDAGEEKDVCSRRPDGAAIDSMKKTLYSLELTRTTHERANVEERARERAQRQYEDVIGGLAEVGRSFQVARNWGQAGETATRGAGHGVRMLQCRQMGKQGWAERRGRGDRTERHTTHTREEEEEEEEFRSQLELPTNGARG